MTSLKTRTDLVSRRYATVLAAVLCSAGLAGCDLLGGGGGPKAGPAGGDEAPAKGEAAEDGDVEAGAAKTPDAARDVDAGGAAGSQGAGNGGATVQWSVAAAEAPQRVQVSKDGVVVALTPAALVGFSGGKQAWSKEGVHSELLRLQDGSMLTTTPTTIIAVDPATGAALFETAIPVPRDAPAPKRGKDPDPPPAVVASATLGSQVLVALADARFYVVDPPACVAKGAACMRAAGSLEGEFLEPSTGLTVAADGTRFLAEEEALRAFGATMDLEFELEAHTAIVGVATAAEGRLALAFGGEIALLDTNKCSARGEIRLARGLASSGPRGCVAWRYGGELDDATPVVVDGTGVAANGNHRMQLVVQGDDSWKSPLGSLGPVLVGESGELFTASVEEEEGAAPTLFLLAVRAAQGTLQWSIPLPFKVEAGAVILAEGIVADRQPGWVVVGLDRELALVAVPVSPAR